MRLGWLLGAALAAAVAVVAGQEARAQDLLARPPAAAMPAAPSPAAQDAGAFPCPQILAGGQPPVLLNPKLAVQARPLCFRAFAVLHSGVAREPLWSAEHLTAAALGRARGLPRVDAFHEEDRLPPDERATLAQYARSGFDRGHMAPSGDMPDRAAQGESFSLANMIPQAGALNRGLWEGIESAVRTLATEDRELYVVTGPIFNGASLEALPGGLLVPSGVFKAVFDPRRGQAGAYVVRNADNSDWQAASLAELQRATGIDVFPALPAAVKAAAMRLPRPTPHYAAGARPPQFHRRGRRERSILEELFWPS